MRWPAIFFKSRKSKPIPEITTVPARSAEASKAAPEKTEIERAEAARNDQEKTESLRALAESGSAGLRAAKESPRDGEKVGWTTISNAKTAPLPATRPGAGMSLRQRAKLTADAHSLPKKDEVPESGSPKPTGETASPSTDAPKRDTGAVVPAAFPVAVETGSVLEKTPGKPADSPPPIAPVTTEAKPSAEAPPAEPPPRPETSDNIHASLRDTARVHIAPATTGAPSTALEPVKPDVRERTEFVLANGERIFGHILSETPQTIYLDHQTLGVLTLPRSQIATKPIEVILINGDRIVGDLIAETPECLYIKHASLGMITVPHSQRSARVVEAILKDGDRILGEVLAETDHFTVIRSATLGTVAVQHEQVAMLNRKIEQMQLRALPSPSPALENKKD